MIFKIFLEKEIDTGVVDEKQESLEDLPLHLKLGKEFTMRITVLQAYGLASEYSDVFTLFCVCAAQLCVLRHCAEAGNISKDNSVKK